MSEATPQKRVLPARERAGSSAKRLATSPAVPSTPVTEPRTKRKYTKRGSLVKATTPVVRTPTPGTPLEEAIPTKIQASRPLPTVSQQQGEGLSNREYQSIAESAVLVASLHRSRMQWLCEGVFKRYWTKPVKRKGVIEQPPANPDVKSMSKLGNATMTIEPHVFDVTFYTVKDLSMVPPVYHRHPNQHTVNKSHPPPINPAGPQVPPHVAQPTTNTRRVTASPAAASTPTPIPTPTPTPTSTSIPTPTAALGSAPTPMVAQTSSTPAKQESTVANPPSSTPIKREASAPQANPTVATLPAPATPHPLQPPHPVAHLPTQSVAPASSTRPANDPVIQMLAARAASDNRLKDLMKVVATSQASPEQLKEFQGHIDEFNRIIKQQEAKRLEAEKPKPSSALAAAHPVAYSGPPRPHPGPPSSIGGPMHMPPPSYMPYPPPRPEPFIKHIVVEFHSEGASSDRWLFPDHAVLDIKTGGSEMIASFFVVLKGEEILKRQGTDGAGEDALRPKFKPDVEYYQPATMLIQATQHKTIEAIARAAKSLPECLSYMKEVMEKKTRAPQEYLVHRLPREKALDDGGGMDFVDSAVELSNEEDDELKDVYGM